MSQDIGTLLAIAEIAGVFVGFAALVSVISRRPVAEYRQDDAQRLVSVVIISAQVIAAALVPIVLDRFGLSSSVVWRVSGGLIFVANWCVLIFLSRATQGFAEAHRRMRALNIAEWALEVLYQGPLLLCAVGLWQTYAPAFYLMALVVALLQVTLFMGSLVASLASGPEA